MTDERDKTLEALDACRPGHDDLADAELGKLPELVQAAEALARDPELRRQQATIERLDLKIAQSLADVSVPVGLAERVLAKLAATSASQPVAPVDWVEAATSIDSHSSSAADAPGANIDALPTVLVRLRSRRSWMAAAAVALAASLFLVLWLRPRGEGDLDYVAEEARLRFHAEPVVGGKPLKPGTVVSPLLAVPPGTRWHAIHGFLGRSGFAYEMRSPAGVRATLYVVKLLAPPRALKIVTAGLRTGPAPHNAGTGGLTTAIWQERGSLYVLVVDGDQRAYQQFVAASPDVA